MGDIIVNAYGKMVSDKLELDKKVILTPQAMVANDNNIYFSERFSDGIYRYNIDSQEVFCLGALRTKEGRQFYLYNCAICHRDKVYFIPCNAKELCIYDISTGAIDNIDLPEEKYTHDDFFCGAVVNDRLYIFGYNSFFVLIYDIATKEFECDYEIASVIKRNLLPESRAGLFVREAIALNNKIYAVSLYSSGYFVIDVENNEKCKYIEVNAGKYGYSGILNLENELWLTPYQGSEFAKYDITSKKIQLYDLQIADCQWSFLTSKVVGEYIVGVPLYAKYLVKFKLENDDCSLEHIEEILGISTDENPIFSVVEIKDTMYFSLPYGEQMVRYTVHGDDAQLFQIKSNVIPDIPSNQIINETKFHGLDIFLSKVIKDN